MGNVVHNKIEPDVSQKAAKIPKGVLTVKIHDAKLERNTAYFAMDPYIVVKITTRRDKTQVRQKAGQDPYFNEQFKFPINSEHIAEGRHLEVWVWDQGTMDKQVAYGIVDVDPYIINQTVSAMQRCYLIWDNKPAGYVNLEFSFKQELIGVMFVHVLSATIRRRTTLLGDMTCQARWIMGEAVCVTEKAKDLKDQPPKWKAVFKIPVIRSMNMANLEILDVSLNGNQLIGEADIDLKQLMQNESTHHETPIFHKQAEAGTVRYLTYFVDLTSVQPQHHQQVVRDRWQDLMLRMKDMLSSSTFRKNKNIVMPTKKYTSRRGSEHMTASEFDARTQKAQSLYMHATMPVNMEVLKAELEKQEERRAKEEEGVKNTEDIGVLLNRETEGDRKKEEHLKHEIGIRRTDSDIENNVKITVESPRKEHEQPKIEYKAEGHGPVLLPPINPPPPATEEHQKGISLTTNQHSA